MAATSSPTTVWDLVILGGGPAGLTCAIYACRGKLSTLVLERMMPGGQVVLNDIIENYPGFPDGISGHELADRMANQARRFGAHIETGEAAAIDISARPLRISLAAGDHLHARTILITTGSRPRKLGIPGERDLLGRGVSYCATCDGPLYSGKRLAVVGGGDTAVEEALFLSKIAGRVTLVHRRDQLRAQPILQERIKGTPNVDLLWNHIPTEILGDESVRAVRLRQVQTNEEQELPVDGIFIAIGTTPQTDFLPPQVQRDDAGLVITDADLSTSVPGIFAAGDVRAGSYRQIAFSVGDGSLAYRGISRYLEDHT